MSYKNEYIRRTICRWVTKQIEERQLSLGRGSGNNTNDLLYQQSKTPWLRLASSVDLFQMKKEELIF